MAITLKGARIGNINLERKKDTGLWEFTGSYDLVTTADTILATQSFNGYNSIKIEMNPSIITDLQTLIDNLNNNINTTLGTN